MADVKKLGQFMMECVQAPVIAENLMDMAAAYQAKLDYVKQLPMDDDGMRKVKEIRTEARKEFEELDSRRKAVKQKVMEPYNKAERIFKSFVTLPFSQLDEACKGFVETVEGQMKTRCEEELKEYFLELCATKGIHWLKWDRLGIRVDMALARQKEPKKAMESIREKVERICSDLDALSEMDGAPDYLAEYTACLDVSEAIRRVNSRKESIRIAEQNRAERESRKEQAEMIRQEMPDIGAVLIPQQEKRFRVTFTVTATMPMLRAMKAWLEDKKIEYQEVT